MKKLLLLLSLLFLLGADFAFALDKQIICPTGACVIKGNTTAKIQTYATGAWQDRLTILNDGKVGIGMTPTVALDVTGTVKASTQVSTDHVEEVTSTHGVQIKGRTDGGTTDAGYVGEYKHQETSQSTTTTPWTTVVTLTLTTGRWLVSGAVAADYATGGTAFNSNIGIKTVYGSVKGYDLFRQANPTAWGGAIAFPTRVVNIAAADDKTITIRCYMEGNTGDAHGAITAIRLP